MHNLSASNPFHSNTLRGSRKVSEEQADVWGDEWAVKEAYSGAEGVLQRIAGEPPPLPLLKAELVDSLTSFPNGTGLGWDAILSRALLRTHWQWLDALLPLLIRCEAAGAWPDCLALVIICLIDLAFIQRLTNP